MMTLLASKTGVVWVLLCLNCAEPAPEPITFDTFEACAAFAQDAANAAGIGITYACIRQEET